ncbi:MAG TPA: tetratricopeptide repeat protein [Oculatellaceae cyanobacterium]
MHIKKKQTLELRKSFRKASFLLAASLLVSNLNGPVSAQESGVSVTLAKHANKAAEYWDKGDYARAKDEFKAALGFSPSSVEYYEGLLLCGEKTQDWPTVAFAADKISSLSPERKKIYDYDYGMALFNLNRYDEAIPHLKAALATADIPVPPYKPIRMTVDTNTTSLKAPEILPVPQKIPGMPDSGGSGGSSLGKGYGLTAAQMEDNDASHVVTSANAVESKMSGKLLNYDNAIRSESILLAEYKGYDKSSDIRFNSPPMTHWHIDKILKGPPLNKDLPLRYDFHPTGVKDPPPGWKFDESMMPEKGSKWIIFIEFSVPDGVKRWFLPYAGSYGRQPATEENLNTLDSLLEQHNMKIQGL